MTSTERFLTMYDPKAREEKKQLLEKVADVLSYNSTDELIEEPDFRVILATTCINGRLAIEAF